MGCGSYASQAPLACNAGCKAIAPLRDAARCQDGDFAAYLERFSPSRTMRRPSRSLRPHRLLHLIHDAPQQTDQAPAGRASAAELPEPSRARSLNTVPMTPASLGSLRRDCADQLFRPRPRTRSAQTLNCRLAMRILRKADHLPVTGRAPW